MTITRCGCRHALLTCGCSLGICVTALGQTQPPLTDEEQQVLKQGLQSLEQSLRIVTDRQVENVVDAKIFHKGLEWALRYDREFSPVDVALMRKASVRGQQRAECAGLASLPHTA